MSVAALAPPRPVALERPLAWWLIATAVMTFLMVVIGGITRLTQSGLSITEWQPIAGVLPPLGAAAWAEAFEKYRQIPQYRELNLGMSLDQFRQIFFWEYLHRLVGRLTGLVALVPPLVFLALGWVRLAQLPRLLVVPVLVLLQGMLGWYMVESGLVLRTSVSQYRLTAHLALALVLYSYCVWQAAMLLLPRRPVGPPGLRIGARVILGLVACTILAGGFTAGTHAGLVYNSFPLMDGRFVPAGYLIERPWWLNPFENVTAIQFDHRVLAETTVLAVLGFWILSRRIALARAARIAGHLLLAAVLLQGALGIATLLLVVPVPLAACHQAGAVLLLTAALLTLATLRGRAP